MTDDITTILQMKEWSEIRVEKEIPVLLRYLKERLEFVPTLSELKDLYVHLSHAVNSYNSDMRQKIFDSKTISDPAHEAFMRFLMFDYGIVKSEKDFLDRYNDKSKRDDLIVVLNREQERRYHRL
jgi:hypothetical protein